MLSTTRSLVRKVVPFRSVASSTAWRFKSSSAIPQEDSHSYAFDENGETAEFIDFPVSGKNTNDSIKQPVLLNAKEHAVGYLSKILNARVYDAAIETDLQEAKNLSSVRSPEHIFESILDPCIPQPLTLSITTFSI
jgi:hypothetical protein